MLCYSTQERPELKLVSHGRKVDKFGSPAPKISGRLFSDSGPRRSSRLSSDSSVNTNANSTVVSGNGTNNSYKGGSKVNHMAFRTMAIRKGQSWANENIDEGDDKPRLER